MVRFMTYFEGRIDMIVDRLVIKCLKNRTKKDDSSFWPEQLNEDGSFPESGLLREKGVWRGKQKSRF